MNIPQSSIFLILLLVLANINVANAAKHALLVGVGDYHVKPLSGPVNDVHEMQKILSERWGFDKKNIDILLNKQGTKKNILAAIDNLYNRSKVGDDIFIYLSGHGTSASDRDLATPLPTTSGAFIPIDIAGVKNMDQLVKKLIVGKNDLRPLLTKFDKGQRQVFVAIDACYSGNTVRSAFSKRRLTKRFMHVRDILPKRAFGDDLNVSGGETWSSTESDVGNTYPYKNIYYLSASGEHEPAQDIPLNMIDSFPTIDGKSHGAFSDTLLRILNNEISADIDGDGDVTYSELKKTVRDKMRVRGFDHTPQGLPSLAEDTTKLASRSIFGNTKAEAAKEGLSGESAKPSVNSSVKPSVKPSGQSPSNPVSANEDSTESSSVVNGSAELSTLLTVAIDENLKQVRQRATQLKDVKIVENRSELEIRKDGSDVLLISQAGDLILRLTKPSVNIIVDNLRHQAWVHQLVAGPFQQDFNVDLELYGAGKGSTVLEGELLGFSVLSSEKAYILMIDIDPKGTVNVLYPYEPSELSPIPANQLLAFKDLSKVTPPFGRDYVQVYAFSKISDDFKALRGKSFSLGSPYAKNLKRLINNRDMSKARVSLELVTSKAN